MTRFVSGQNRSMGTETIAVEVAYGTSAGQTVALLQMVAGSTVIDAIRASGLLEQHPAIDLATAKVGIFSKIVSLDAQLKSGDRVEIYRDLVTSAQEARRRRAKR